jgi:hypothetical protein
MADKPKARLRALPDSAKGLSATGYIEGQNVTVEYHWLEGHYEGLPALLADLVQRRVTVIATLDTASHAENSQGNPRLVRGLSREGGERRGIAFDVVMEERAGNNNKGRSQ